MTKQQRQLMPLIDPKTADGRLALNIMSAFAKWEDEVAIELAASKKKKLAAIKDGEKKSPSRP